MRFLGEFGLGNGFGLLGYFVWVGGRRLEVSRGVGRSGGEGRGRGGRMCF